MRPIPLPLRKELEQEPRMKRCAVADHRNEFGGCFGRIFHPEWHHPWMYAGTQINEPWAIVGGCTRHHEMVKTHPEVRKAFERVSLLLATPADLAKYPRKDWSQIKKTLK